MLLHIGASAVPVRHSQRMRVCDAFHEQETAHSDLYAIDMYAVYEIHYNLCDFARNRLRILAQLRYTNTRPDGAVLFPDVIRRIHRRFTAHAKAALSENEQTTEIFRQSSTSSGNCRLNRPA